MLRRGRARPGRRGERQELVDRPLVAGVRAADDLVPWHPTLGDVDSAQALADYQAAKREHKAQWSKGKAPA